MFVDDDYYILAALRKTGRVRLVKDRHTGEVTVDIRSCSAIVTEAEAMQLLPLSKDSEAVYKPSGRSFNRIRRLPHRTQALRLPLDKPVVTALRAVDTEDETSPRP